MYDSRVYAKPFQPIRYPSNCSLIEKLYIVFKLFLWDMFYVILPTTHLIFFLWICPDFESALFQKMPGRATSEYTKMSFVFFVKFTQKYPGRATLKFKFFNLVKLWNFWNSISPFFSFSWRPTYGDFGQKKVRIYEVISDFFLWYLVFFPHFKLRLIITQKKSRYQMKSPDITFFSWLPSRILV